MDNRLHKKMKIRYLSHSLNSLPRLRALLSVVLGLTTAAIAANGDRALSTAAAPKSARPRIAVLEFTPGTNAAGMTYEAKRHLQASIAYSLASSGKFHVADVRNTREATQSDLLELNGAASTDAVVKAGQKLNVHFVLAGTITDYNTKTGHAILKTRLIDVDTGKVKHSAETIGQSTSEMSARAGEPEMMNKVLRPAIEKLTAGLTTE
jgi:TolB-like protein